MYSVTIDNQRKTFHHVKDLRLYVVRHGDKDCTYFYDGHGPHYAHNKGRMWFDQRWLVATDSNVYRLDREGNLIKIR